MSTAFAKEDDQDIDINDPRLESEDLSGETSDIIPKSQQVPMTIRTAKLRIQLEDNKKPEADDNKLKAYWLSLGLEIGSDGIDEEGRFAGRRVFQDLCVRVNKEDFPKLADSSYYSRAPYTQFLRALGFDLNPAPNMNKEFRESLIDRDIVADIFTKSVQDKVNDEWVDTGDFKNVVKNFRAAA